MKTLLVVVSLLVALGVPAFAAAEHPPEYKSVDCPDGDVYLILERAGTFVLVLELIDRREGTSLGHRKISGKWDEKDGKVRLVSGDATIVYRREPSTFTIEKKEHSLDGLRWESSTKKTFADSWTLVDRIGLEKLAYRFAPPAH